MLFRVCGWSAPITLSCVSSTTVIHACTVKFNMLLANEIHAVGTVIEALMHWFLVLL
jgi:hypothetical protein